jgi:hypothetical protein
MSEPKRREKPEGRKRDSIGLSQKGKKIIKEAQATTRNKYDYGLNQERWASKAFTSVSTLKRFLSGEKVSIDNFISLCNAVGIAEWENLLAPVDEQDSTQVQPESTSDVPPPKSLTVPNFGNFNTRTFMMTATFTENNKDQKDLIEQALEHLKSRLMDKVTVTFHPNGNCLAVSGTFDEETKKLVEVTLLHLEQLLNKDTYKLTMSPTILDNEESKLSSPDFEDGVIDKE